RCSCGCRKITANTVAAAENTIAAAEEITANTVAAVKQPLQNSERNTLVPVVSATNFGGACGLSTRGAVVHRIADSSQPQTHTRPMCSATPHRPVF
ncbi:hypothetical protein EJB05_35635, partial [Eragrostis curvula]